MQNLAQVHKILQNKKITHYSFSFVSNCFLLSNLISVHQIPIFHREILFPFLSVVVYINPLPHSRKTPHTPWRQVAINRAKDNSRGQYPARRHISSLVPAYEVCVLEWLDWRRGPLKIFHLHRDSARAGMCAGGHGGKWRKVKPERTRGLATFSGPGAVSMKVHIFSNFLSPN